MNTTAPNDKRQASSKASRPPHHRTPTPALMLLGTSSHVGKSLLTAAFCRYYKNNGLKVAPFKAQNMSSNLYMNPDGLALSAAQAMQAQAAKLLPDVRMNPIALRPAREKGVEVFWLGRSEGCMDIKEYFARREDYFAKIREVYAELAGENDLIVLEGAGSPAEINLRDQDLVNMSMAKAAGAKAVLIGDIERGGVFASLAGTLDLLEPDERELIHWLVINKFRGDYSLLEPGLAMLTERTGKPFAGVLPHFDPMMPEEDSLGNSPMPCPRNLHDLSGLDEALDRLAAMVAEHLDVETISAELGMPNRLA